MSSGSGLFRKTSLVPASGHDASEPRRRHGSAPLSSVLGLPRRESVVPSTSSSSSPAGPPRRSLALDLHPPRKMSESGIVHKPSPLSPKRKPVPRDLINDKEPAIPDDEVNGKLGKLELSGGSTMVIPPASLSDSAGCWQMYVLRLESSFSDVCHMLSMHCLRLCQ
jgi:hypothetical protein